MAAAHGGPEPAARAGPGGTAQVPNAMRSRHSDPAVVREVVADVAASLEDAAMSGDAADQRHPVPNATALRQCPVPSLLTHIRAWQKAQAHPADAGEPPYEAEIVSRRPEATNADLAVCEAAMAALLLDERSGQA